MAVRLEQNGLPLNYAGDWTMVVRAATAHGVRFAWFDARDDLGHLVEVYERHPLLTGFYERLGIDVPS